MATMRELKASGQWPVREGCLLRVALRDAHWPALCREPMTRDFVSSSSNRRCRLWCRPSPPAPPPKQEVLACTARAKTRPRWGCTAVDSP